MLWMFGKCFGIVYVLDIVVMCVCFVMCRCIVYGDLFVGVIWYICWGWCLVFGLNLLVLSLYFDVIYVLFFECVVCFMVVVGGC